MSLYRILSIDAGGINGILPAILLERLNERRAGWLDDVDLIAGASFSAVTAIGLARGLEPGEIRSFFERGGPSIFHAVWLAERRNRGSLAGADYGIGSLRSALQEIFGTEARLGDLRKRVLIPTFDLDHESSDASRRAWKPKLFGADERDGDVPLWRVALYACATPTWFPSADGFIDGSIYAANPAMCALAAALGGGNQERVPGLNDVRLLSIGAGTSLKSIDRPYLDWGGEDWGRPLVEIAMDDVDEVSAYQCKQLLGRRQFRLAPVFPGGMKVSFDGACQLGFLSDFAGVVDLRGALDWIDEQWSEENRGRGSEPSVIHSAPTAPLRYRKAAGG